MHGYPKEYKPKPTKKQVELLKKHYPELGESIGTTRRLPAAAEGRFLIPNIWIPGKQTLPYSELTTSVLRQLGTLYSNGLCSGLGECTPFDYSFCERIHQLDETVQKMQALSAKQGDPDMLTIAAQLGKKYQGQSARNARALISSNDEIGLGVFAAGCILLTHPERLQDYDDLWMHCTGDECRSGAICVPRFWEEDAAIRLSANTLDNSEEFCGTISGFQ